VVPPEHKNKYEENREVAHERKQKERQNRKVNTAARTQRKIKTRDEGKTSE